MASGQNLKGRCSYTVCILTSQPQGHLALKLWTDIHGAQMMNPLAFPRVPPAGNHLHLSCELAQNAVHYKHGCRLLLLFNELLF